ncbi:hypothetical protein psyc5s11_44840 [Clostridium gelidum]|uniref:DUF2577 domain-containing protein n=1 Tax=Clostridium gelidum TaxID=704125 RepID=A0ABM7T8Z9_9CLOT|nr:hypothetical protein [Clostridium gelidum]BCZ48417.1 hypothetical protein psyc5s11_44840 [Clostridium gelidum]
MITEKGINKIANLIVGLVKKGQVTVEGITKDVELYRTAVNKDTLKIFLLLDDTFTGKIENKNLIDQDGEIIFQNSNVVQKDTTKGLLIVFSVKISEVEV